MALGKNANVELRNDRMEANTPAAQQKPGRKMPGTRAGTIEDWRAGDSKKGSVGPPARSNRLRDGS